MLRIGNRALAASAAFVLDELQAQVDAGADYPSRVVEAKRLWDAKTSGARRRDAFTTVRKTLARLCVGPVRCAYCEDSAADEVEHVLPKDLFPDHAFRWMNYAYACGPCNGPKSNRYGTVVQDGIVEFVRRRGDPVVPPPQGDPGLIDPRVEEPTELLELDLGGRTPEGLELTPTFWFNPREPLAPAAQARAGYTIEVLDLNRELLLEARRNAYGGFRARLVEYVKRRDEGAPKVKLRRLRDDLLHTPHLTVFHEMRRQRRSLPKIDDLLKRAPEAMRWKLVRSS